MKHVVKVPFLVIFPHSSKSLVFLVLDKNESAQAYVVIWYASLPRSASSLQTAGFFAIFCYRFR